MSEQGLIPAAGEGFRVDSRVDQVRMKSWERKACRNLSSLSVWGAHWNCLTPPPPPCWGVWLEGYRTRRALDYQENIFIQEKTQAALPGISVSTSLFYLLVYVRLILFLQIKR